MNKNMKYEENVWIGFVLLREQFCYAERRGQHLRKRLFNLMLWLLKNIKEVKVIGHG